MPSDSTFSYVHMNDQQVLVYMDSWDNHKLRWDDIEFSENGEVEQYDNLLEQFFSQHVEAETDSSVNHASNPIYNTSYANRSKQKKKKLNWKDVDLDHFLSKGSRSQQPVIHDETILKKPNLGFSVSEFFDDAESSNMQIDNSIGNSRIDDINTTFGYQQNSDDDYDNNDNFNSNRNISNPDISRNFFQTPILNNRVHQLQNFQGSTQRSLIQQRKFSGDNSSRNTSYNTPRHDNIR